MTEPSQDVDTYRLMRRVRALLILFVGGLLISGITAFPLQWEVNLLKQVLVDQPSGIASLVPGLSEWIARVHAGINETYRNYPFMAYGTDWLAFAHIVIAVAFWGPIRDPVRNVWVIEFGMIACVLVVPMALIAGPIRGIPIGWVLIDTSFGIIGIVPLWLARRTVGRIMQTPGALTPDGQARTDLNLEPGE